MQMSLFFGMQDNLAVNMRGKMKGLTTCLSVIVLASLLLLTSLPVLVTSLPVLVTSSEAQTLTPYKKVNDAPGPVLGGGLSFLVIAGGAYRVVTRLRRTAD
jgi:hypothetical protein